MVEILQDEWEKEHLLESSSTGIQELDDIIKGGFPKGSVVLLAGSSGSGKTICSLQWLFEGVKKNENGIYISTTEPLFKTVKHLEAMTFYDRDVLEKERVKLLSQVSVLCRVFWESH